MTQKDLFILHAFLSPHKLQIEARECKVFFFFIQKKFWHALLVIGLCLIGKYSTRATYSRNIYLGYAGTFVHAYSTEPLNIWRHFVTSSLMSRE